MWLQYSPLILLLFSFWRAFILLKRKWLWNIHKTVGERIHQCQEEKQGLCIDRSCVTYFNLPVNVSNFLNLSIETISRNESCHSYVASWFSARKQKVKHNWIYCNLFDDIKLCKDELREKDKSFICHYAISACQVKSKRGAVIRNSICASLSSARKCRNQKIT